MDEEIYRYIKEHSSRQSEALAWVEKQTNIRTNHARMLSGSVQGELLRLLVKMSGAKRVLELGTFTGYSTICLASALPEDGHLDTLELNDELEDLIREGLGRAGVSGRVSLHIGDCKETLARMGGGQAGIPDCDPGGNGQAGISGCDPGSDGQAGIPDCKPTGDRRAGISGCDPGGGAPEMRQAAGRPLYDLAFIDANKREYCDYYELVFPLVRHGGWILADNVLWDGKVCAETLSRDRQTQGILAFNETVAADQRVENVILPLRDGLNIILKK